MENAEGSAMKISKFFSKKNRRLIWWYYKFFHARSYFPPIIKYEKKSSNQRVSFFTITYFLKKSTCPAVLNFFKCQFIANFPQNWTDVKKILRKPTQFGVFLRAKTWFSFKIGKGGKIATNTFYILPFLKNVIFRRM